VKTGETIRFRTGRYALGEFHCPPGDWRWREVNAVDDDGVYVVFPGTSVVITHLGHEPLLTNRNHVVFYGRGQRFLRRIHDPRGDHCIFVRVQPTFLAKLLARDGVDEAGDLPFVQSPSDPHSYRAVTCAVHALRRWTVERLALEELVVEAVRRAVERAAAHDARRRRAARASTELDHHRLVEETKALLIERTAYDDTLAKLASELHVSEFHLCRVFREHTGFTLHRYRQHLRLRLALELLAEQGRDVATIAQDVGFASHSHFTDAFRSVFGVSPSRARRMFGRRELLRLRGAGEPVAAARGG
jgi:AraC family transcriptional regulator